MTAPHFTITAVHALPDATLQLSYADGVALQVRLADIIRRHPTLAALADPAVFASARCNEWGDAVIWAGQNELELAADNLRARGLEQTDGHSQETASGH